MLQLQWLQDCIQIKQSASWKRMILKIGEFETLNLYFKLNMKPMEIWTLNIPGKNKKNVIQEGIPPN